MINVLVILAVALMSFGYGLIIGFKYEPSKDEGMNEYKRKFLLWYVRNEINRFNKKNDIKSRKEQVAFLNKKLNYKEYDTPQYKQAKADIDRLSQLMKWEYSLRFVNKSVGEDMTHRDTELKHFSGRYLEPTTEQWAKYGLKVKADSEAIAKKYKVKSNGRTSK